MIKKQNGISGEKKGKLITQPKIPIVFFTKIIFNFIRDLPFLVYISSFNPGFTIGS